MNASPTVAAPVTRHLVTRCELCGRPVAYKPGRAADALTAHYATEHMHDLNGWHQASHGWEPLAVRVLRVLAAARGGLSADAVTDALGEGITPQGITPRRVAARRNSQILRQLAAAGKVTAGRAGHRSASRPASIWHITDSGRRHIAAVDTVPPGESELLEARRQFGPGTPAWIRRSATAIFRSQGFSVLQIARVFEVTGETIRRDLRQASPDSPGPDPNRALQDLAARAQKARQAVPGAVRARRYRAARAEKARQAGPDAARRGAVTLPDDTLQRFGPGAPMRIRRSAAAILRSQGFSVLQIARVFGVAAGTIRTDVRQAGSIVQQPDVDRALRDLAARAEEARAVQQALNDTRGQLGPGTSSGVREEIAAILDRAGMSSREIGKLFGVTGPPIRQSLKRHRPGPDGSGYDPAVRLRELARTQNAGNPQ